MEVREIYDRWLQDFADDPDTVAELRAIADDDKEIEERFYTELSFGTAGMRGVIGAGTNRMNRYNVRRATKALALVLKDAGQADRGVVIAYDSRRFSKEFAQDTALVLCQEGVKAYLFDALRPVPILSFAVRHLKAAAGIVITASHNPKQYNGYKVYGENGAQVREEAAEAISAGDEVSVDFDTGIITDVTTGQTWQAEPFPEFIQNIIQKGGLLASLKEG